MAEGVRTFSFQGRKVREFKPLQPREYDGRLQGNAAAIKKSDKKPGAVPYLLVPVEALGTAEVEGGKNRTIHHMLFITTEPQSDGSLRVEAEDQLLALAQSMGVDMPEFTSVPYPTKILYHKDPKTQQMRKAKGNESVDHTEDKTIYILSPDEVKEWLIANDGKELRFRVKTQKGTDGYPDKSVIGNFIIPETVLSEGSDDASALFDDAEGGGGEEAPAQEEEVEVEEVKPAQQAKRTPPPPAKKTAPPPAKSAAKRR